MRGKVLVNVLRAWLKEEDRNTIMDRLTMIRKQANILRPPEHKAADAIKLQDLEEIWKRCSRFKVEPRAAQALEILTVAFATTSRVAEIVALRVADVAPDGSRISVRTKTQAATCKRCIKHVGDTASLFPTEILRRRRERAALNGGDLLFTAEESGSTVLTSSEVTKDLKRLMRSIGMNRRVTAHSGRKGAAVTALLAGVPVPAIQALGAWKREDSLQAYLAKSVREQFSVMELVKPRRTTTEQGFGGGEEKRSDARNARAFNRSWSEN